MRACQGSIFFNLERACQGSIFFTSNAAPQRNSLWFRLAASCEHASLGRTMFRLVLPKAHAESGQKTYAPR